MDKIKLEARRLARRTAAELAKVEAQKAQKPVKEIIINIEWHKSRTWGSNPSAEAQVSFADGTFTRKGRYTASGCGYDKESTVIAEVFNDFLRYKLYRPHKWTDSINGEKTSHPYGVCYYGGKTGKVFESGYITKPTYNGGVGTTCYYKIAEFIGGKFERISGGKSFDVFKYTDK